jgi:hypothetical protein
MRFRGVYPRFEAMHVGTQKSRLLLVPLVASGEEQSGVIVNGAETMMNGRVPGLPNGRVPSAPFGSHSPKYALTSSNATGV